jgi:hypothetical protein
MECNPNRFSLEVLPAVLTVSALHIYLPPDRATVVPNTTTPRKSATSHFIESSCDDKDDHVPRWQALILSLSRDLHTRILQRSIEYWSGGPAISVLFRTSDERAITGLADENEAFHGAFVKDWLEVKSRVISVVVDDR